MEDESLSPYKDKRFVALTNELKQKHNELRQQDLRENPVLIGDYLDQLRLGANLLFGYLNRYIEVLVEIDQDLAKERQALYEEQLAEGKSPSASDLHAKNLTRVKEAKAKAIQNHIQQIKNEYERYNTICMSLQTRMKEFISERHMG
jgi:hypothetical protein